MTAAILVAIVAGLPLAIRSVSAASSNVQVIRFDSGNDDRPGPLVVDGAGNFYIGAMSDQSSGAPSFAVIKYRAAGTVEWVARYAGGANEFGGAPSGLALDAAGNVYAAGYILRRTGTISSDVDTLVVSFGPNGAQRWAHRVAADGFDAASTATSDGTGVYVTGMTGSGNDNDWFVRRYSTDGAVAWETRLTGALPGDDRPIAATLDATGALVVLGFTSNVGVGGAKDITTAKFNAGGQRLWATSFSETDASDEFPSGLAVDQSGNIYVTGETVPTTNPELEHVPVTVKYSASGQQLFLLRGDGAGGSSVAVDPAGFFVVNGSSMREGGNPGVTAITKFSSAGQQQWLRQVAVDGRLSIDASGSVFLGGNLRDLSSADQSDFFALKLDAAGAQQWQYRYTPADRPVAQGLDTSGAFYLMGEAGFLSGNNDIVTLKFAADFVPGPVVPVAPSNLSGAGSAKQVTLGWRDNSNDETSFRVERCTNAACSNFAPIATTAANATTYVDKTVSKNTTYTYRVLAINAAGPSTPSNVVTVKAK
jgi:sugar lactone lactonase YvrE